jgi:hypothetical protein
MEPQGTLARSQDPATGRYAEAAEVSPRSPSCLFEIHFNIILLSAFPCSTWFSLLRLFGQIVLRISHLHHACYMPIHQFDIGYYVYNVVRHETPSSVYPVLRLGFEHGTFRIRDRNAKHLTATLSPPELILKPSVP